MAFNLTAQLNLVGPTNIKQIASQIKKDLGNINAKVQFKLDPNVAKNVAGLSSSLKTLNSTFANTVTSATAASSAIKSFGNSINSIKINNIPQKINATANSITSLNKESTESVKALAGASSELVEFGKQAGLAVRRFVAFSAVTSIIYGVTNSINNGVQAFIDYDKELVKLQQVTGESASGLSKLQSQITNLSVAYGVSSKELTAVASTLAQAGLSARETEKALKALALSSLAPSFDGMNETVEGSIALMRQFGISAEDLEASLGSVNTVAARFAVESKDIITAIQRTGSVFATASKGVSEGKDALNEFIAVFTSVRATTRESAETIATGLRTIFTRVQRGQTIDALKEFGVNLTDAEGKFVGAYKAVELLSSGLNKLDPRSLDFSRIVEELGGFRQIGKVIPLIQQFAVTQEALKVAQRGQGSLARDAATAQLSLANQISKVREEFFALFREIGQSKGFQTLIRGALSLVSGLIKVTDAVKGILPALAVITAFKGAKGLTQFIGGFNTGVKRGPDGKANGGVIRKFARGGVVPGTGSGDTVPAMLEPGEFVIRKKAVETIGSDNLHSMNKYGGGGSIRGGRAGKRKKFAKGGIAQIKNKGARDGDSWHVDYIPASDPISVTTRGIGYDAYELTSGKEWEKALGLEAKSMANNYFTDSKSKSMSNNSMLFRSLDQSKFTQGRPLHKVPSKLKRDMIKKGVAKEAIKDNTATHSGGPSKRQFETLKEIGFNTRNLKIQEFNLGGKIQKFVVGGKVTRNLGYIDFDIINDPANEKLVEEQIKKSGSKGPREYTQYLTDLAIKAKKETSIKKLTALYGVAGAGKSSIAMGRGANDAGRLRETNRFPILTPEDISKASEVMLLTSTVSKDKLDGALKEADKIYALSTTTQEEKDRIRKQRMMRDVSGVGLFGRRAGATTGVPTDSAKEEALLTDSFGSKAMILGRGNSGRLRRKRGDELVQITKKKLGFTWGGFSPTTAGHESIMDAAKAAGIPYEDFIALVGANEAIDPADDSYRTAIFDQDFRLLLAKAGFGAKGASVLPKAFGDMSVPLAFDMGQRDGRRQITLPAAGSMAFVADKTDKQMVKYEQAGYGVTNLERMGGISGTAVRKLLLAGNLEELQKVVSPGVFSLLKNNLPQLQNRSAVIPSLVQQAQSLYKQEVLSIDEQLAATGITRADNKKAAIDPDYAAQLEIYQYLKEQKKKLATKASFEPYRLLKQLAEADPDKYALKLDRAGENGIVSPPQISGLQEAILKKVAKETSVQKSSGILPAQGSEILKRFGTERLPNDPSFGPFSGKTVRDTADGGKLKYWNSAFRPETKADKLAYYTRTRDYLIDKFNGSQGTQKATTLAETTNAVLSSKQLGLVGLNPLGYTGLLGPETWNLGVDSSGQERSIDASIIQRGLPTQYKSVIDYLSGQTEELVGGAAKLLGISPKKLSQKERETLGQGNIEGALLEQIFGSAGATVLNDALRTRPIDFPMGIGPKAAKIFGIDPDIPTEVKRTIDSGSRSKAVEEFQKYFRQQYGIPEPKDNKVVQKLSGGGLLKKYGEIFPSGSSTGPFKEMVFDFDDTLVTGGEIRLPDGRLDLSRKDDMPLVQEMLKKGKLTPLGQHLSEALKQEPSLMDNVSVLSARNPNQAGILAQTLQNLGLPIPASKIRGSNGPQNKKITGYQKMIDDNLETITRLKDQGHEAIHYKFAKGGKIEEEYKSILASILPKEMLTSDSYLKRPSGEAEPISFIAPPDLATKNRNEMMSILLGKSQKVSNSDEDTGGAYYRGALKYKTLRHNLEKNKDQLPKEEYEALKTWVNQAIVFQGDDDDLIKTTGARHKGVLAHETFHDIQGYLYDNHPEIMDKLLSGIDTQKEAIAQWYADPKNKEWTGPKNYKLDHFFPNPQTKSPYDTSTIEEASYAISKRTKKPTSVPSWKMLGMTQQDFGRNEAIPVLLSAAAVGNAGATEILSKVFGGSGLNADFYKTLPKFKLGGVIRDIWHGTTTGQDDSVLESFKKYGAKSDVSSGFGQGQGFYVYSDPTSAMVRAMELQGGANYLTAADPNGKPMALKFTELLDGKNWDLDYEFQNADIVNFIHSHYDRVKEAVAKSKGVDLGTNLKDFSLDQKYDEYLDTTDNTMMRKVGISFKDQGKDAERLLANNHYGDARSGEVLSSLVKSLMHSDPDFYEEFENSFFNNLKPKQGLKYVGKDPLKPVLAQIFNKQKNIDDTGWITEKFAKGGQAGVSPQDTVPALLTPGEFVINKKAAQNIGYSKLEKLNKADKIQGFNRGGAVGSVIQKFATGGSVLDMLLKGLQTFNQPSVQKLQSRPSETNSSTIEVSSEISSFSKSLVDELDKAGYSMKSLKNIIEQMGQGADISYKQMEKALEKDLQRLKISGASIEATVQAEKALSDVRNQSKANIVKRQFLEAGFKESKAGKALGSGASQQKILMEAEKKEKLIIAQRRQQLTQSLSAGGTGIPGGSGPPLSLDKIKQKVQELLDAEAQKIKELALIGATQQVTGVKKSELEAMNIGSGDIKSYITQSTTDRKTLAQMDKQLIAGKIEELKNSSDYKSASNAEQRKLLNDTMSLAKEEVSKRRQIINEIAKEDGSKGVGAAGLTDWKNSPVLNAVKGRYFDSDSGKFKGSTALGDVGMVAGLVGGQGENIANQMYDTRTDSGKVQAAKTSVAIQNAGSTLATGLTTAAQLAPINPLLAALVTVGTAAYAAADAVYDFSGAQADAAAAMEKSIRADKIAYATDVLNKSFETLMKSTTDLALKMDYVSKARTLIDLTKEDSNIEAATNKGDQERRTWSQYYWGGGPLADIGQAMGISSGNAYAKEGVNGLELQDYQRLGAKQAEAFASLGNQGYQLLPEAYKQGFSREDIIKNMDLSGEDNKTGITRAQVEAMVLSDPNKATEYQIRMAKGQDSGDRYLKEQTDNFFNTNAQALAAEKADKMARALEAANKAGRRLADSFELLSKNINESIGRTNFESEARAEAMKQNSDALRGKSESSGPKLRELNVLNNPSAYTDKEYDSALSSATSGIKNDRVKQQIIGGSQLEQRLPKAIKEAISTEVKGNANLDVDEATKLAIKAANAEIDKLNIRPEQKEDLKTIARTKIEEQAEKTRKTLAGKGDKAMVDNFLESLDSAKDITGDFSSKMSEVAKELLSFRQGALKQFAEGLNAASKALKDSRNYEKKARDIRNSGNMNFREVTTGVGETFEERQARMNGDVASLTGGVTSVAGIKNRMLSLQTSRQNIVKAQEATGGDPIGAAKLEKDLRAVDDQLRDTAEALEILATSTELVEKAFNDLKNARELQKNRESFINTLLTNTPEEADKLNQTFIRLQRNLSGGLNDASNQRDARKAFNQTLRETGSVREATKAGNTVLANQRKETLAAMNDPGFQAAQELNIRNQYAQGKGKPGVSADEAVADYFKNQQLQVMKSMAVESGMINNPLVRQAIAAKEDPTSEPAMAQAADRYLKAVGLQSDATKAQGELALLESQQILAASNNNLKTSIDDLNARIDTLILGDAGGPKGIVGKDSIGENVVQLASRGGLMYAQQGQYVNFQPKGTDTVPAMLTPGEFVINAKSTAEHLPLLKSINSGYFDQGGLVSNFTKFDKNKNRLLDRKEFTEYFSDFDLNKDDAIDMKEFRSGINKQDLRRKALFLKGSKSRTEEEETEYQNLRSLLDKTKSGGIGTRKEMIDRAKGQIRYERQQAYLSRFRPEIRERKEERLLRSGMLYFPDGTSPRGKMFKMEGSRSTENVADLILPPPYKNVPNTINPNTELLLPNPSGGMLNSSSGQLAKTQTNQQIAVAKPTISTTRGKYPKTDGTRTDDLLQADQSIFTTQDLMTLANETDRTYVMAAQIARYRLQEQGIDYRSSLPDAQPDVVLTKPDPNDPKYQTRNPLEGISKRIADNRAYEAQQKTEKSDSTLILKPTAEELSESRRAALTTNIINQALNKKTPVYSIATPTSGDQITKTERPTREFMGSSASRRALSAVANNGGTLAEADAAARNAITSQAERSKSIVEKRKAEGRKVIDYYEQRLNEARADNDGDGQPDFSKTEIDKRKKEWESSIVNFGTSGSSRGRNPIFRKPEEYYGDSAPPKPGERGHRWSMGEYSSAEDYLAAQGLAQSFRESQRKTRIENESRQEQFSAGVQGAFFGADRVTTDSGIKTPQEARDYDMKLFVAEGRRSLQQDKDRLRTLQSKKESELSTSEKEELNRLTKRSPVDTPLSDALIQQSQQQMTLTKEDMAEYYSRQQNPITKTTDEHGGIYRITDRNKIIFNDGSSMLIPVEPESVTGVGVSAASMLTPIGLITAASATTRVPDIISRINKGEATTEDILDLVNIGSGLALSLNNARTSEQLRGEGRGLLGGKQTQRQAKIEQAKAELAIDRDMKQALDESRYNITEKLNDAEEARLWESVEQQTRKAGKSVVESVKKTAMSAQPMRGTEYGFGGGDSATLNARAAKAMEPEMLDLKSSGRTTSGQYKLTSQGEKFLAKRIVEFVEKSKNNAVVTPGLKPRGNFMPDVLDEGVGIGGQIKIRLADDVFALNHEGFHAASDAIGALEDAGLLTPGVVKNLPKEYAPLVSGAADRARSFDEYIRARQATRGTSKPIEPSIVESMQKALVEEESAVASSLGQKPTDNPSYNRALKQYNRTMGYAEDQPFQTQTPKSMLGSAVDFAKKYGTAGALAGLAADSIGRLFGSQSKDQAKVKKPARRASGGLIYAENGQLIDFSPKGTDTVPAMLTPGEFVVNAKSTKENLGLLHAINKNKGGKINYLADGGKAGTNIDKDEDLNKDGIITDEERQIYQRQKEERQIYQRQKELYLTRPFGQMDDRQAYLTRSFGYSKGGPVNYLAKGGRPDDTQPAPSVDIPQETTNNALSSYNSAAALEQAANEYKENEFLTTSTVPTQVDRGRVNDPILAYGGEALRTAGGLPSAIGGAAQYGIGAIGETAIRATHIGQNAITSDDEKNPSMLKDFMDFKNAGAERAKLGLAETAAGAANVATLNMVPSVNDYWNPITHNLENNISSLQKGREESSRKIGESIDNYTSSMLGQNTFANMMEKSVGVADYVGAEVIGGLGFEAALGSVAKSMDVANKAHVDKVIETGTLSKETTRNLVRNTENALPGLTSENMTASSVRAGVNPDGTINNWSKALETDPTLSEFSVTRGKPGYAAAYEGPASGAPAGLDSARTTKSIINGEEHITAWGNTGVGNYTTMAGESPAAAGIIPYVEQNLAMGAAAGGGRNSSVLIGRLTDEASAGLKTVDSAFMDSYNSAVDNLVSQGLTTETAQLAAQQAMTEGAFGTKVSTSMIEPPSLQKTRLTSGNTSFSQPSTISSAGTNTVAISNPNAVGAFKSMPIEEALSFPSQHAALHKVERLTNSTDIANGVNYLTHEKKAEHHNSGGLIYANNGAITPHLSRGTDTVPAMLTPGEFVINREASQKHMPILQAINNGYFNRGGIVNYLANGGAVMPQYSANGGPAKTGGGVSKDAASSSVGDALSAAVKSAVNDFNNSIQKGMESYSSMMQSSVEQMNSFGQTFSNATQTLANSAGTYSEAANNMPDTVRGVMEINAKQNVTGLGAVGEQIVGGAKAAGALAGTITSQNTWSYYDRKETEGAFNTSSKNKPITG